MIPLITGEDALRRLFAALTEHTFQVELGVADPALTDYLVEMLMRFSLGDSVFGYRDGEGHRIDEVADMLAEADHRRARPRRELLRHIGDYTLFWSGLYPEALSRLRAPSRKDHLIDYERTGKESYLMASAFDEDPFNAEAPVLRRLSEDFEMCRYGLNRVRHELDHVPDEISANSDN